MSPIGISTAHPYSRHRAPLLRRTPLLAALAVAALTATACAEVPTGTLSTRAGFTLVGEAVPVSVCPAEDESRLAEEEGTLLGAHFALRVECVASFEELPEGFQLEYLFGEDIDVFPAEAGHQFTLVQFAPDPGHEPPEEAVSRSILDTKLNIGEQEWHLEGEAPEAGSVYLAVAPTDAPIQLTVEDDGRSQGIDLRERTRTDIIEGLYNGSRDEITSDSVTNEVSASRSTGGYDYWVDGWTYETEFTATRSVYDKADGWVAELDRAELTIGFWWYQAGSGLEWDIDPEKTLTVSGAEGELKATSVDHEDDEWGEDNVSRYYTLVYDVSADDLVFDLEFHPDGAIDWPEHGIDMPVTGDKNHKLSVDFS